MLCYAMLCYAVLRSASLSYAVLLELCSGAQTYAVLRNARLSYAVLLRSATKNDAVLQREAATQCYALPCCATQAPLTVAKQCCCAKL